MREKIRAENERRILPDLARKRLRRARAEMQGGWRDLPLADFVHAVSPYLDRPDHLRPFVELLEDPIGRDLRTTFAAPPQVGKSETVQHALARLALRHPGRRHAYLTYNQTKADGTAWKFWQLAERAGLEPSGPKKDVRLRGGTEIRFRGLNSGLTGEPIDGLAIIDDPVKDAADAASVVKRDRAWAAWEGTIRTRLHPGAGVIVMATRWHVDDPTGRFIALGWPYINIKAICEDGDADDPLGREPGESLWSKRPPEFYADVQRDSPYTWAAMYQGRPVAAGGSVFGAPTFYDPNDLPKRDYRIAHGIDLAYAKKVRSDWSVIWTMLRHGERFFVVDVKRVRISATDYSRLLKSQTQRWPGRVRWNSCSTTEVGAGELLGELGGVHVTAIPAKGDKLFRAQPLAAAWNAGRILLPAGTDEAPAPQWVHEVIGEFGDFTGVADRHDDLIDGASAAFDELAASGDIDGDDEAELEGSRWDGYGRQAYG